jgi:hypothetical protein
MCVSLFRFRSQLVPSLPASTLPWRYQSVPCPDGAKAVFLANTGDITEVEVCNHRRTFTDLVFLDFIRLRSVDGIRPEFGLAPVTSRNFHHGHVREE